MKAGKGMDGMDGASCPICAEIVCDEGCVGRVESGRVESDECGHCSDWHERWTCCYCEAGHRDYVNMSRPNANDVVDWSLVTVEVVERHELQCERFRRDYGDGCICEYVSEARKIGEYLGWYSRERNQWHWKHDGEIPPGL